MPPGIVAEDCFLFFQIKTAAEVDNVCGPKES